jgi:hypothetical protein
MKHKQIETKIISTSGTIALILIVALASFAGAIAWYYSQPQNVKVVDNNWIVTTNALPAEIQKNTNLIITGTVSLSGTPQVGITVTIFNGANNLGTTTTDAQGTYTYSYPVTDATNTILSIKAGVQQ